MDLRRLTVFREAALARSFTRAGSRLHMTQSAVSHQIKALEAEVGEPLFHRGRRGVLLTERGARLLESVAELLDAAQRVETALGAPAEATGRVRVAAATQAFVHLFVPFFEAFMRGHPGIEVTFRTTASTDQTLADLKSGAADAGFASLPLEPAALTVTPLFEDELVLVVGYGHPLAGRDVVEVDEIRAERFILFERGASIRRATDRFFAEAGLRPELALESNDTYFIKLMVERGMGISLLPSWAVKDEVAWGWLSSARVGGR
ncbi:MAG TPA: LysR family transcriptional regulator, partial [Vicinamibacteria bacterium]|nr:LysR family transcriptional regulator [Vicinamibacteria bacterium]